MKGKILALDLATQTGWAIGAIGRPTPTALEAASDKAPQPKSGSMSIGTGPDLGRRFAKYRRWVDNKICHNNIDVVVMEAPLPGGQRTMDAARIAFGLAAITEMAAHENNCMCREVSVGTIKKHATGSGHAKKPEMMRMAKAMGWTFSDDNECDALWLLDYATAVYGSKINQLK